MRPRRAITRLDAAELFDDAVAEHALAVLSVQDTGGWQIFKARFLERDPGCRFFVLDYRPPATEALPALLPGQYVGVSLRHGNRKVLFATVVEARGHYLFDSRTTIPAVRFRWPDALTELQRRSYYRTPVPETMTLPVSLWAGGLRARAAAQTSPLAIVSGTLADVSCGGALVRLHTPGAPAWNEGQTLGVELHLNDGRPPLPLDALHRGARHDQLGQLGLAVQFIGLEMSVDGRLALQRLARCVQRLHRAGASWSLGNWSRSD